MNLQTLQPGEMVQLMQGRPMQLVTVAINLLLVVWIAWMLANVTLDLLENGDPVAGPVTVEAPPAPQEDQYRMLVGQVSSWKLMGEAKVKTAEPARPSAPVVAPETRLKLTLRGSLDSDDTGIARAIIADQRGQEELYSIGDKVPGNAELSEIHIDRVILLRGGRYETLSLPENTGSSGSRVQPQNATTPEEIERDIGNDRERKTMTAQKIRNAPTIECTHERFRRKRRTGRMITESR